MSATEPSEVIKLAISSAGGVTAIAKIFGMERTSIYKWIRKSRVPPQHVKKLSDLSGFSCHIISPEIFPDLNNGTKKP